MKQPKNVYSLAAYKMQAELQATHAEFHRRIIGLSVQIESLEEFLRFHELGGAPENDTVKTQLANLCAIDMDSLAVQLEDVRQLLQTVPGEAKILEFRKRRAAAA